jgi:8-oxo-dGTP pyrophosphatase MutT (NUDIX family)
MQVVYAKQTPPESWKHAIFLAGPTPRDPKTPSWRPEALKQLEGMGYDGVVFVPEQADGDWKGSYTDQTEWESMGLEMSDRIVFWVPRDLVTMPAFTTNVEFGRHVDGGKVVLGFPEGAPKMRYLDWMAGDADPDVPVLNSLKETLEAAIDGWEHGPTRTGGERYVPRHIWDTPMFRGWYENLQAVGNRLDEAKVKWIFTMPKARKVFSWVLWVKVWIAEEGRYKENEWIFARTDVATVVMYRRPAADTHTEELAGTEVVLVKEFRSPGRTDTGFIHELPGGSVEPGDDNGACASAAREAYEETGISIAEDRLRPIGSRQGVGILSTHHIHAFAVELEEHEMAQARKLASDGTTFGEEEDTELTYVEVKTVRELLVEGQVDWTTLGLVMRALTNPW